MSPVVRFALIQLAVLAQPWLRALLAGPTGAVRRPSVLLAAAAVPARNRRNAAAMDAALAKGDRYAVHAHRLLLRSGAR